MTTSANKVCSCGRYLGMDEGWYTKCEKCRKVMKMQTYYKLEDYDWVTINEKGFIKGSIVWFADLHSHNETIETGVVVGHDIHIEGDIELKVEITKEYKKYPDEIWDTSDKVDTYTYTKTVFMDDCFFNKEDAISDGKTRLKSRIKTLGDRIKYERKKLKELENM